MLELNSPADNLGIARLQDEQVVDGLQAAVLQQLHLVQNLFLL